jgi:hypothetical protein
MNQNLLKGFACAGAILTLVVACLTPARAQTAPTFAGVLTQHNDNGRTGQNLNEEILTPTNVNATTFGKVMSYSVDGQIYAQPLYVPNVSIPGQGIHNVVYVETQNDSLFAFDADALSPTALWQVSFVNPAAGITPVSCQTDGQTDISCGVYPIYGINSTPVIDPSTKTMYLVTRTNNNGKYFQTLHAIDITTGAEKFGGPVNISGSVPGTGVGSKNGTIYFDPLKDVQRTGLLLSGGGVYVGWAGATHGWIMGFNATTLKRIAIFNTTPNAGGSATLGGGGIWASGNGLAADPSGNIYAAVGDSTFDANDAGIDYGDSLLKLSPVLKVLDYFTPNDQSCRSNYDLDLGSAGPMLLPNQSGVAPGKLLIAGKGGAPCDTNPVAARMYLLSNDNLGKYNTNQDQAVEEVAGAPGGYWSSPAYWHGASSAYVYAAGVGAKPSTPDPLKMFTVTNGLLSTAPTAESPNTLVVGATPSVSATGTQNGIVWAIMRPEQLRAQPGVQAAVLYAYDATNVANLLYDSSATITHGHTRDRGGCAGKFAVPTIANGRVYVGTQNQLDIYGLLGSQNGPGVYLGEPCWTFPASTLGTTVTENVVLSNSGNSDLTISNFAITGTNAADFSQTNNCPASLAPGAFCSISLSFTASVLGPETAYVMITDNAVGSPHNIYAIGVGEN